MKNLFILHTQYNIMLALSLISGRFKDDTNDLILFLDFSISDDLKYTLDINFNSVHYFQGTDSLKKENYIEKNKRYRKILSEFNCIINKPYDKVFIVDDMCIPEMYALKLCYKHNKNISMIWLEDGAIAYYSNGVKSYGMGNRKIIRVIRKIYFGLLWGLGRFYSLRRCMGDHKLLKEGYFVFPQFVKKELNNKKITEIKSDEFLTGLNLMYGSQAILDKSVIIAMDKLDVYTDLNVINSAINELITQLKGYGYNIYCKYHPRENSSIDALEKAIELDKNCAIESYYNSCKNLCVIGFKSTGLQTAKKLGVRAVSLINIIESQESRVKDFFYKIEIECPLKISDINL